MKNVIDLRKKVENGSPILTITLHEEQRGGVSKLLNFPAKQKPFQLFLSKILAIMFLSGIFNPLLAQVGSSCSNPVLLGSLNDTTLDLTISYPDTIKWYSLRTDSSRIGINFYSTLQSGYRVKQAKVAMYDSACVLMQNGKYYSYPGKIGQRFEANKTVGTIVVFSISRHYDTSCGNCDSLANQVKAHFQFRNAISSVPCTNGNEPCGNLVKNGSFSHRLSPVPDPNTFNTFVENLCVWTTVPAGNIDAEYFSSGFNDNSSTSSPYSYLSTHPFVNGNDYSSSFNFAPYSALYNNANDGFVGVETGAGNSDILKTDLSSTLVSGDYYLCYFVSPGDECKNYHDKIDASISSSSYSTALPITLSSGIVTNNAVTANASWTKLSKVFTASGGENKLYLGNIANGNYGSSTSGNALSPLYGTYYFIDNAFLKKWEMPAMNDETVCSGESVLIGPACSFPEVTYEWIIVGSPTVIGTSPQIAVSPTTTTIYQLTIYASTISGTVSISGTLTVYVDLVNASLTTNPGILAPGGSSILVALPTGTGYTYEFFEVVGGIPSAISAVQSGNTFNLTGLTMPADPTVYYYQVIITTPNGCTGTYNDSIIVTETPCEGPTVITLAASSNWAAAIAGSLVPALSGSGITTYTGYTFFVEHNFNIEYGDVVFENCTFYMDEGANLRITNTNSGVAIQFQTCAFVPCTKMWRSITIESPFSAKFLETLVTQSEFGIVFEPTNTGIRVANSSFIDNIISITGGNTGTGRTDYFLDVTGSTFLGTGNFVAFYPGQPAWNTTRPAVGIYVRNCNFSEIGLLGDNSNQFTHLFTGIQLRNSIGEIENCFFDDIKRTPTIPWTGALADYYQGQGAATSSFAVSEITVHGADGQNFFSNPTMNNCYYGVRSLQSDFDIEEIFINFDGNSTTTTSEICHEGILMGGTPVNGTISHSIIRARQKGIFLDQNPNAVIVVDSNEVFITGQSTGSIHHGLAVLEASTGQRRKHIRDNIVHCVELSNAGYYFSNVDSLLATHNLALDEKTSGQPNVNGFHLQTSNLNTFNCNRAEATSLSTSGNQKGFFISSLSPNNLFECNFVDNTNRGFQFQGLCLATRLTTTSFNLHTRGLDLVALSTTQPVIGVQGATNDFWGNVWNFAATGTTPFQAANSNPTLVGSKFFLDPADAYPSLRNPVRPTAQLSWFDDGAGKSGPTAACVNVDCANLDTWEQISSEEENLQLAIQTEFLDGEFGNENLYFMKQHALDKLKTTSEDYSNVLEFNAFLDSVNGTNLEKLFLVENLIQEAIVMADADKSELSDFLSLRKSLSQQINQNLKNGINDTLLASQFSQVQSSIDYKVNSFRSQSNLKRISANWINNSITPENQIETNQKEINSILISKVHFDGIENLSNDSSLLYSIAIQCLATGGKAVVSARNLFYSMNPVLEFQDDTTCNMIANARRAQNGFNQPLQITKATIMEEKMILYPNPSNGTIYLEGNGVKDLAQIRIFDAKGNLIFEKQFYNGNTYF
jgi:hypothetical protein